MSLPSKTMQERLSILKSGGTQTIVAIVACAECRQHASVKPPEELSVVTADAPKTASRQLKFAAQDGSSLRSCPATDNRSQCGQPVLNSLTNVTSLEKDRHRPIRRMQRKPPGELLRSVSPTRVMQVAELRKDCAHLCHEASTDLSMPVIIPMTELHATGGERCFCARR